MYNKYITILWDFSQIFSTPISYIRIWSRLSQSPLTLKFWPKNLTSVYLFHNLIFLIQKKKERWQYELYIYAWTGWMATVRNWSPLRKKGLFSMIAVEVQNLTKTSTRSKHKLLFLPNCMDQAQTRKDKIGKMSRGQKKHFALTLSST